MHKPGVTLFMAVALLTAALPQAARAGDPYRAALQYEECMDQAQERLDTCLDIMGERFGELCWSGYGYAKMYCSLKYGYDLLRKE